VGLDAAVADAEGSLLPDLSPAISDAGAREDSAADGDTLGGGLTDAGAFDARASRGDAAVHEPWRLPFEDVTRAAGIAFTRVPADALVGLPDRMSGGVCVLDVDGRPPLDLFFALRPSVSGGSRLYVARRAFEYVDETEARGLHDVGDALGCLAVDLDDDGDDDLLVTGIGGVRWLDNRGGRFVDRSGDIRAETDPRGLYMGAAAGDLDGDGDLDLAVSGFIRWAPELLPDGACGSLPCTVALPRQTPIANLLLFQESSGTFVDVAVTRAPALREPEMTLLLAAVRLEGLGPLDLFVGNDFGSRYANRPLRRGADGVFVDVSEQIGLARNRRGYGIDTMGWTFGDIDGDGHGDHVVTSFVGDATAVFLCRDGFCEDFGPELGMNATRGTFRWGAALADLDLDGDLDLVEATGHVFIDAELATMASPTGFYAPLNVLENEGGRFLPYVPTEPSDPLSMPRALRGVAVADLDDDGRPDLVFAPADGPPLLLRNRIVARGHFVRIALRGRGAVGATVVVSQEGRRHVRARTAGEGYLGNFDPRVHFGLATDAPIDVEVRYADGAVSHHRGLPVDTTLTLVR
jgi:hypothetical protein